MATQPPVDPFWKTFAHTKARHVLLVVVHVEHQQTVLAMQEARLAYEHGADGAIFIASTSGVPYTQIQDAYRAARAILNRQWFLGVNFLDLDPIRAVRNMPVGCSGLQLDDMGVDETLNDDDITIRLEYLWKEFRKTHPRGLLLGGVDFKGHKKRDPERVARLSAPYCHLATSSGVATGVAAEIERLKKVILGAGDTMVGLASGIRTDNVAGYKIEGVRAFLVNTSLNDDKGRLVGTKITELAQMVHEG